jgi:hypothetical protein
MKSLTRRLKSEWVTHPALAVPDGTIAAAIIFVTIVTLSVMAYGCNGGSGEQAATWNVAMNSDNALERTRAWEICGGTIFCSFTQETPPNQPAACGFYGSATASQAACYQQYSGSDDVTAAEAQCQ